MVKRFMSTFIQKQGNKGYLTEHKKCDTLYLIISYNSNINNITTITL